MDRDFLEIRAQKSAWNIAGIAIAVFVGGWFLVRVFG